jgi:glycosyltransferase involved in cell wall biosynthesis
MAVPAISIVIPLYNKRAYIREALDSVGRQIFTDYEVIVVDDGSTDGGAELAAKSGIVGLRLLSQANRGVSAARNRGIAEAAAGWVAFLDADDIWNKCHLLYLWNLHSAYPQAALLANGYSNSVAISDDGAQLNLDYRVTNCFIDEAARGTAWAFTSATMIRRDVAIATGGFALDESRGEDIDLWVRIALSYPVALSSYIGAVYRKVGNSLTATVSVVEPDVAMRGISRRLADDPHLSLDSRRALEELFNRLSLSHAADCLLQGNKDAAARFLDGARCTRYWPQRWWILRVLWFFPSSLVRILFRVRKMSE